MRSALFTLFVILAAPAAADHPPLAFEEAQELIGMPVLTSDAVPLGRLVATRALPDGGFHCIVQLDAALEARTSALIVEGLTRAPDGSLRLAEAAEVLADQLQLRFGEG